MSWNPPVSSAPDCSQGIDQHDETVRHATPTRPPTTRPVRLGAYARTLPWRRPGGLLHQQGAARAGGACGDGGALELRLGRGPPPICPHVRALGARAWRTGRRGARCHAMHPGPCPQDATTREMKNGAKSDDAGGVSTPGTCFCVGAPNNTRVEDLRLRCMTRRTARSSAVGQQGAGTAYLPRPSGESTRHRPSGQPSRHKMRCTRPCRRKGHALEARLCPECDEGRAMCEQHARWATSST